MSVSKLQWILHDRHWCEFIIFHVQKVLHSQDSCGLCSPIRPTPPSLDVSRTSRTYSVLTRRSLYTSCAARKRLIHVRSLHMWDPLSLRGLERSPRFPHGKAARCARARSCSSSVRARLRLATRSDLAFVMLSAH